MYKCDLCGHIFNRKSNYTRHVGKVNPCVPHEEALVYYKKKLQDTLYQLDIIKKRNTELEEKAVSNHPNTINNTINGDNNSNITVTGDVNIHITQVNAFGNEDTSYITDADYERAVNLGLNGLQHLVHKKYLAPKHRENWNMVITNLRGDTCKVLTNNGCVSGLKSEYTDIMYRNTNIDLEEFEDNNDLDRPTPNEIDLALYDTDDYKEQSKTATKNYNRLKRQTELKISSRVYNQKLDRQDIIKNIAE